MPSRRTPPCWLALAGLGVLLAAWPLHASEGLHRFTGTLKAGELPEILFFAPIETGDQSAREPPITAKVDPNGTFTVDLKEGVQYQVASHPPCAVIDDMVLGNGRPIKVAPGGEVTELPGTVSYVFKLAANPGGGVSANFSLAGQFTGKVSSAMLGVGAKLMPLAYAAAGGIKMVSDPCADAK